VQNHSQEGTQLMATVKVLDSHMAYTEVGSGPVPVVFLNGNPT
jgi:haloalkane dehalogenase